MNLNYFGKHAREYQSANGLSVDEISGSHTGEYEDNSLLEFCTM